MESLIFLIFSLYKTQLCKVITNNYLVIVAYKQVTMNDSGGLESRTRTAVNMGLNTPVLPCKAYTIC